MKRVIDDRRQREGWTYVCYLGDDGERMARRWWGTGGMRFMEGLLDFV